MGRANLSWRCKQGLAASGETELVQDSAGGNKACNAGQIDQAEHTGYLKIKQKDNTSETSQACKYPLSSIQLKPPSHLGKVLVDGCEGLTPR